MSFKDDVISTSDISGCYQSGLSAIKGSDKSFFRSSLTRNIQGSIDIDSCLVSKYPSANRWDYVLGYEDTCFFVEVHPASTSEVSKIIAKKKWLIDWLRSQSSPLLDREHSFHWIASGKVDIRKGSRQEKLLNLSGIKGPKKICECKGE